jgi:hypothetical protein
MTSDFRRLPNMSGARPNIVLNPISATAKVNRIATTRQVTVAFWLQTYTAGGDNRDVTADWEEQSNLAQCCQTHELTTLEA